MRHFIAAFMLLVLFGQQALAQVVIDPSNAAILYSPYNWNVATGAATSINAGAYFKTLFSGNSCSMSFNVTNNSAPVSQIWWRVDAYGPWTQAPVAASVACTIPTNTSASAYHLLEVTIKSTSEALNRWNNPSNTAVIFTSLSLDTGATVVAPPRAPRNIAVYGDSIDEGVRTVNQTATNDTDRNDAMETWSFSLGRLLGAEVGIIGFGAAGLTVGGSGNVPALPVSFNMLYAGQPRVFTLAPDLIVLMEGTNDGGNNTTPAAISVLNGLLAATPVKTRIAVLRPFSSATQAANLQAAVTAASLSGRVFYIDTAGVQNNAYGIDGTGLHPTGANSFGVIGPLVAAKLAPLLLPARQFRSAFP